MINLGVLDLYTGGANPHIFKRVGVRAIIIKKDKLVLVESTKYHDVKFPGGGVELGEELIAALKREIKEETGYLVVEESIQEFAYIKEKRNVVEPNAMLDMTNYYYLCQVADLGERCLDKYEAEYGYEVVELTLDEAIKRNELVLKEKNTPWVTRELKVLKYLQEEGIV